MTTTPTPDLPEDLAALRDRVAALETALVHAEGEAGRLRAMLNQIPAGICVLEGPDHIFSLANPAYLQSVGERDLLGQPIRAALPEMEGQGFIEMLDLVYTTGEPLAGIEEPAFIDSDGSGTPEQVWRTFHYLPLRAADGQINGVLVHAINVTKQVRASQQARQLHAELGLFQQLVEEVPDGVSLCRPDGTLFYANPAYQTMTGLGADLLGKTIFDIYTATRAELADATQAAVTQGTWQGMLTLARPDGSTLPVQVSVAPILTIDGRPHAFAAVAHDMTGQLRAEHERLALHEQVIAAQQATLRELSTPLIPLAAGVVAMPIVGTIDSARSEQIMETLLEGITQHQAETAILDITGVKIVDTQVADALLRAARAAHLLGAHVVLTGIGSEVAQTLVSLGVDLSTIITRSTIASAIGYALGRS